MTQSMPHLSMTGSSKAPIAVPADKLKFSVAVGRFGAQSEFTLKLGSQLRSECSHSLCKARCVQAVVQR